MASGYSWVAHTILQKHQGDAVGCHDACLNHPRCARFTFKLVRGRRLCFLKSSRAVQLRKCSLHACVSGSVERLTINNVSVPHPAPSCLDGDHTRWICAALRNAHRSHSRRLIRCRACKWWTPPDL